MKTGKHIIAAGCGLLLNFSITAATAEVVVVVSAQSDVKTLDNSELSNIFLGKTSRLPNGEPAIPIDQADGTPARDEFYRKYLERSIAQIKAHWSKLIFTGRGKPPMTVADGESAADRIAANPNTVGYVDRSLVDDRLRVVSIE